MKEWKNGKMERWKTRRLEEWNDGRVEEWKSGRMEEWKNGRMEGWKNGRMEGWNVEALAEIPLRREKNGRIEDSNYNRPLPTGYFRLPTSDF
jgi:hypothetical protein